jgi:hypothetical protein
MREVASRLASAADDVLGPADYAADDVSELLPLLVGFVPRLAEIGGGSDIANSVHAHSP